MIDKDYNIEEILDKLVGHTSINCETNHDNESYENLNMLGRVINWGIDRLYSNSKYYNDYRGSADMIAKGSVKMAEEFIYDLDSCLTTKREEEKKSEVPF